MRTSGLLLRASLLALATALAALALAAPAALATGWQPAGTIQGDSAIFPGIGMAGDGSALAAWFQYDGCSCGTIHTAELAPGGSFTSGPSLDPGGADDHTPVRVAENARAGCGRGNPRCAARTP